MAYGKRYYADYKSLNGYSYHLELWQDGWTGGEFEMALGDSFPRLSYDASASKKFTELYSGKLSIPWIVETAADNAFLIQLIRTLEEKEIYVYLWRGTSSQYTPIFAGYLLMDLSSFEDVYYPFEAELTATDGLGLLKEVDFVHSATEAPYELADTYIPDGQKTFVEWIAVLLGKAALGGTAEGNSYDMKFSTSVNWYNKEMNGTGQADDPLKWTRVGMSSMYELSTSSTGTDYYKPKNAYQVLQNICRTWGMRVIIWKNKVRFVQLGEYNTSESGTITNPDNINTRIYELDGTVDSDVDNLGSTWWSRYQLEVDNSGTGAFGIQKLATTKYEFFPRLKHVFADFLSVQDQSFFKGFPQIDTSAVCGGSDYKEIDKFIDADQSNGWWLHLPLTWSCDAALMGANMFPPFQYSPSVCWTIRGRDTTSTWALGKQLQLDGNGDPEWVAYQAAPIAPQFFPGDGLIYQQLPPIIGHQPATRMLANFLVPTDAAFAGEWEFRFYYFRFNYYFPQDEARGHGEYAELNGGMLRCPSRMDLITNDVMMGTEYAAYFSPLTTTSAIGNQSVLVNVRSAGDDSHILNIGQTFWGDGAPLTPTAVQVFDGTNWVYTDIAGGWEKGGLSGARTLTELLCDEALYNQQSETYRANWKIVLAQAGKSESGRPRYINPLGRIKDTDNKQYIFGKGTFNTGTDEWNGQWFGMERNVVTTTTGSTGTAGSTTGTGVPSDGNNVAARLANPNGSSELAFTRNEIYGCTSAEIVAGATTSISINPFDRELLKDGDKIDLIDVRSNVRYSLTVAADQSGSDTTLTIDSYTFAFPISVGSFFVIPKDDLLKQYQNQTHGSVAAFEVDADGLTKGGIEITGWLDSDTMTGASANSLSTSESIKAYCDANAPSDPEYLMATCTGIATTSATDGEAYAVIIPFDTESVQSTGADISISEEVGEENCIRIASSSGVYKFDWNVTSNTSVVDNRTNMGVKLQIGTYEEESWQFADIDPSHCYIYNRAASTVAKLGSASGSILVATDISETDHIYRLVFWKDTSNSATTKGITVINGTQITITKIT